MAEIILPPEENEESPQVPELNIDKPTENSKVITIEFEAKKTNKVSTKDTNQQLYTTDTDAWFEFKETSLEGANGTYSVVFRNRDDGSIFQRTGDVVNGVAYYKIPHQEIRHAGAWRGQIVYTLSNGDTTSREFGYDVKGHILDGKDVREIVVEDFETLMAQLRSMKDNAESELANLTKELRNTTDTAEQNETDRQAFFDDLVEDIDDLQANYQELLDTGVLQTNINEKLEQLEEEYAPKLTEVAAQLAQTDGRVDNLVLEYDIDPNKDPEIIDARKGKGSLRAKVDSIDNALLENKREFEYLYSPRPVVAEWYQGSLSSATGRSSVTVNRIRSSFTEVTPGTDYFFKINEGFEFWILEFRERLADTVIAKPSEFHPDIRHKTSPTATYIRIVIRRTGAPVFSSDPEDEIHPEDIVLTGLQVYTRSAYNLVEMSEATDEIKNVNSYVSIEETDNVIEIDVSSDRNFYVDIVDMAEKHVVIRGLHKVRGNMISRVLVVNALVNARIKFPSNMVWQNDNLPTFSEGRTYMVLFQSFNGGISWLGTITSSWKNKEYLVYDDFDRPDQLGLGQAPTGQVWEYSPTSVWEIRDGSARVHTFRTDDDNLVADMAFCESGESNVRVSAVMEELTSSAIRLVVRVSDIHNYIEVGRTSAGLGVFERENGVQTELRQKTPKRPFVDGDTISVELEGNNIRVYHNDHFEISVTTSFNENATKHGIFSSNNKNRIFHNFSVEVI